MLLLLAIVTILKYIAAEDTKAWAIPLDMYNDRANLPFGIDTDVSGTFYKADGTSLNKNFNRRLNMTVNVNMPFSIFFDWKGDFPDNIGPNETVKI